jgi:hypothetical protein
MLAMIQDAERTAEPLSAGGWAMMIFSITAVTALVFWCYKRILTHPENDEPDLPGGLGP